MYLKKLSENRLITIEYSSDGVLKCLKGRVFRMNWIDQIVWLKDEKQKSVAIHLSCIRQIH